MAEVFRRFKEANNKLKPSKCAFAKAEVKYLGHLMAKDGIKTDPDKLKVMTNFPVPKNIKDIKCFLGLTGFYRRFQWCCSTPQGSPGVGRNTFLSSPHLCFIIVFICDLFVSRDDPLMS